MKDAALNAIELAFADPQMDPRFNIIARTVLGDIDGATQVALQLADLERSFETDFLFMPEFRRFRQHRDFLPLMDKLGVQKYWDDNQCVWRGDEINCPG